MVGVAVMIVVAVVVGVVLRTRLSCVGFAGPGVTEAELPPPLDDPARLRLAAFNVRNFPLDERPDEPGLGFSRRTNICDLQTVLGGLDADLLALTEIRDTRRFPPILRRAGGRRPYREIHTMRGGFLDQYLTLAWDSSRLEKIGDHVEVLELALDGGYRPGLGARFRSRTDDGFDFTVLAVHLAAGRKGADQRRRQYELLARWAAAEAEARGDDDIVILGDFNTAGSDSTSSSEEIGLLDAVLAAADLRRVVNRDGCSEYWEGPGPRDGIQLPALLDLVYVRGFPTLDSNAETRSWLHCARARCAELVSRPGAEDGTFWDVSDHCPITLEVALPAALP